MTIEVVKGQLLDQPVGSDGSSCAVTSLCVDDRTENLSCPDKALISSPEGRFTLHIEIWKEEEKGRYVILVSFKQRRKQKEEILTVSGRWISLVLWPPSNEPINQSGCGGCEGAAARKSNEKYPGGGGGGDGGGRREERKNTQSASSHRPPSASFIIVIPLGSFKSWNSSFLLHRSRRESSSHFSRPLHIPFSGVAPQPINSFARGLASFPLPFLKKKNEPVLLFLPPSSWHKTFWSLCRVLVRAQKKRSVPSPPLLLLLLLALFVIIIIALTMGCAPRESVFSSLLVDGTHAFSRGRG